MQRFQNILFVCQEVREGPVGLRQAMRLMRENDASLKVAIYQPELPENFSSYREQIETSLKEAVLKEMTSLCEQESGCDVGLIRERTQIAVLYEPQYPVDVVKQVLRHDYDVLIKDAEPTDNGLNAVDMTLLRKCPCPVWLCRDTHSDALGGIRMGVAIDPLSPEKAGEDLAVELIRLSASMAARMEATLYVLSCWEWKWERAVRNSAFVSLPEEELNRQIEEARGQHEGALQRLIERAGIDYPYEMEIRKGKADHLIPAMIQEKEIDILVMGTVARTGIPGFLIGNTAENIAQRVECSIMAVKPHGFVSPIEAY